MYVNWNTLNFSVPRISTFHNNETDAVYTSMYKPGAYLGGGGGWGEVSEDSPLPLVFKKPKRVITKKIRITYPYL